MALARLLPGFLFGATAMFRPEYPLVAAAFVVFAAVRWAWQREWALGADRGRPDVRRPAAADRALDDPQHRRPRPPGADLHRRRQGPLRRHLLPGRRRIPAGQGDPLRARNRRKPAAELPGPERSRTRPRCSTTSPKSTYPELARDSALGKIGKEELLQVLRRRPARLPGMTARKVGRMWSSGVGAFMATTPGRVLQIALVLLGIAGLVLLGFAPPLVGDALPRDPDRPGHRGRRRDLAAPRRNEILMTLIFPLAGLALAVGRRGPILRGRNGPTSRHIPGRTDGAPRRRPGRRADPRRLRGRPPPQPAQRRRAAAAGSPASALAIVTGTEVVNGLLSAFSFEKGNGGRILGLAVFAIFILFIITLRALSVGARNSRQLSAALEGLAWEEFRQAGLPGPLQGQDRDPDPGLQRGREHRRRPRPDARRGLRRARPRSWSSTTAPATGPATSPPSTAPWSPATSPTAAAARRCAPATG